MIRTDVAKPKLRPSCRLVRRGEEHVLAFSEGLLRLDGCAREVLSYLDGSRTTAEIAAVLADEHATEFGRVRRDVDAFVEGLVRHNLVEDAPLPIDAEYTYQPSEAETTGPYVLVAELTYRCPFRCAYCSNPVDHSSVVESLTTEDWARTFDEAARLGVTHVHLTGGEPLLRGDLVDLVRAARAAGLYTAVVTSGVPGQRRTFDALREAGLDALQLSFQSLTDAGARKIAGLHAMADKVRVATWAHELGLPLTVNVVLRRDNMDDVDDIVGFAESLDAYRLELASTQYVGWALVNYAALLPSPEQVARAREAARQARRRLRGRMEVVYVLPDLVEGRPRACMSGWARRYLVVTPDGLALPCHAARTLGLPWHSVTERSLSWIWRESPGFSAFRGEGWMSETCRSCELRGVDFGGCRCQAALLVGDAAATDPACSRSPHHERVRNLVAAANERLVPLRLRGGFSAEKRGARDVFG